MKFKEWLLHEKAFDGKGSDFSKSPSLPMGFGDLRQMRRWSYMGRPTQPDWQRAASAAVGGFGDAFRDTMANMGIRPGAPGQWPGDEEYENNLDVEVFINKEELGMDDQDLREINPQYLNNRAIKNAISDKAYQVIMSGTVELDSDPNDFDLTKPNIFDLAYHENQAGQQGVKASISYPLKKGESDRNPDYRTRADRDKEFGAKRGVGDQSVPNPKHGSKSFNYQHDRYEKDWGEN